MVAAFNQTAAAPESLGNIWFSLHNGLAQVYTHRGWLPVFDPFAWHTKRIATRYAEPYGPQSLELLTNGVNLSGAGETGPASFTLGSVQMNEGYRVLSDVVGEPIHLGVRVESAPSMSHPLLCMGGICMCRRDATVVRAVPGMPVSCAGNISGCMRGVTTATDRPTWAFGCWLTATLHSGASNMGLIWTMDGPLAAIHNATSGF